MSRNPTSLLLVLIQSLMLAFLFLNGPVIPTTLFIGLLEIGGIILMFWAIWTMRTTTFQITPDLAPESVLIINGPYSFIRHPMYTGLLLIVIALLFNAVDTLRVTAALVLLVAILIKAGIEENQLEKRFGKDYKEYEKKTKRFIPFVY